MSEARTFRRRKTKKPPVDSELQLGDWGPRGSVFADLEGRRILVDRGVPGERVVALVERTRKPWRGTVQQVVKPSEERVEPLCPYYAQLCGGCQLQHFDYDSQLRTKEHFVNSELQRAGVRSKVERVHKMSNPWRYRRTAAVAIGWEAGFRPKGRRGIVEIHDCLISHPLIGQFCDRLNASLRARQLPNYHGKVWLECTVVGSSEEPSLQVLIQGIEGLTLESHPELPEVGMSLSEIEGVASVAFRHRSGEPRAFVGQLMNQIEVDNRSVYLPAGSFFQTNLEMLGKVIAKMRKTLAHGQVLSAADVYGGVGVLGLSLLDMLETLTLIELDSLAVEAARKTAEESGAANVTFINGHAEAVLGSLPSQDLVIVDPPRSGLGEAVTTAIADTSPFQVFYLSCSPPSLAADLAGFHKAGYRVRSLEMFDFYPQTYHVESLAILERWT